MVGVQAPFNFGYEWAFDSILELADFYYRAIKLQQPEGPYRLAGWSAGGLLAQQVACLLTKAGDKVEYLVAMDSALLEQAQIQSMSHDKCLEYALKFAFGERLDLPENESVVAQLDDNFADMTEAGQLEAVAELVGKRASHGFAGKAGLIIALKFFVDFVQADRPLTPTRIDGNSLLITASQSKDPASILAGWQRSILSDNRVVEVDGEHGTMMKGQCLEDILVILRAGLLGV